MSVTTGTVAFANLLETEKYNGQDTNTYSVVLQLDDEEAAKLEQADIRVKTYKDTPQRKFKTKFSDFKIIDADGEPMSRSSVRYGAKVRVQWTGSKPHPSYGVAPYLSAIRVLEEAEGGMGDDDDF